jgi:hypothetical protein
MDLFEFQYDQIAGSCEHYNKQAGSIKCREFLASQEGLCSM